MKGEVRDGAGEGWGGLKGGVRDRARPGWKSQ